jgi:putative NADPH-quinone reductase
MGFGDSGGAAQQWRRASARRQDQERLLIVNGHPDPRPERFCAALCQACLTGAAAAGRDADVVTLGDLFPANGDAESEEAAGALALLHQPAHLTVIFPLWLDKPPEIATRFFARVARSHGAPPRRAHVVVTMSLPAFAHRSMLRDGPRHIQHAMSLPGLEMDALNFVGSVDTISQAQREEWLYKLRRLGSGKV